MLTAKERTNIKYGFFFWSQSKFEKTEDIGFILFDKNTAEARRLNQSFEQFGSAELNPVPQRLPRYTILTHD